MSEQTGSATAQEQTLESDVVRRIADYRHVREQVERDILPLATSVDGRSFELQASLYDLQLRRGGYVVLEAEGRPGWARSPTWEPSREMAAGAGPRRPAPSITVRLARGGAPSSTARAPRSTTPLSGPPTGRGRGVVRQRRAPRRAGLDVGELLLAPGVPAVLDSGGLNRHTFMCGQSGSGKTYSLGVLLERVLAETSLRVVILDPNSDYVGARAGPRRRRPRRWRAATRTSPREVAVWSNGPAADHPLRMRFADLDPARPGGGARARPDPATGTSTPPCSDLLQARAGGPAAGHRASTSSLDADVPGRPAARACGPGTSGSSAGSCGAPSCRPSSRSSARRRARCTVVDLGSLDTAAGAAARRRGRAVDAVGRPAVAAAVPGGDRRGAQHLPGRARRTT